MATYPKDRFDELPEDLARVGAHRAVRRPGRGWIGFGIAVAATLLLTGGGLLTLAAINDIPIFGSPEPSAAPEPEPTEEPTAEPVVDPEVPITVLNGSPTAGLATVVGDALVAQGWNGAALGVGSRANAADRTVEETIVYYNDPELEGAARGLVLALGVGDVRISDVYETSPLTIVLGSDYRVTG